MRKAKSFSKRIFCIILALALVCTCNISAFASANSGALTIEDNPENETRNYRAYLEYIIPVRNTSTGKYTSGVTAGVIRQNTMHTYVKAGETVYFGSSVYDSFINEAGDKNTGALTGSDIVVTYPDGSVHSYDVDNVTGEGFIDNRAKETNGPRIAVGDTSNDKYIPLSFTAEVSGLYDFSFRSRTGAVAAPTPVEIYDDEQAIVNQGRSDIAFWDITVADQYGNPITGRTYSKYLALSTGATYANMVAQFYVVTNDGYIYKTYLENMQPFGFIFFSNNQGLTTTGLTPSSIYHSVYDNDNNCDSIENEEYVTFHHPYSPDTDLAQTNMIFFEEPSKDLIGILFDEPVVPQPIENVLFYGHEENKTYYTQGGTFKFESHGATSVSLVIDFNLSMNEILEDSESDPKVLEAIRRYRAAGGSGVVEINGATVDGWNSFEWDGRDDKNIHMPIGVYNSKDISLTSYPKAGEVHFPMLDVEGIHYGVRIERLNGAGGRDDANPSLDRFGICYNNNPLVYGTIEGPDSGVEPVLSDDGKYYILSDGTRSYKFTQSDALAGASYFVKGYQPTSANYSKMHQPGTNLYYNLNAGETPNPSVIDNNDKHISTLVKNDHYIAPEDEIFGSEVNTTPEYGHVPVNSQDYNMTFGTDGANSGGGNQSAIDIGTYYYGEVRTTVKFESSIEIIDNIGIGDISGRVFFDDYNKGKYNGTYAPVDGDYPLSDIKVVLTDINGNKLQKMTEDGYPLFKDNSGNELIQLNSTTYINKDDQYVDVTGLSLTPEYYYATTDLNGAYTFKGVYYGTGQSKDFYVKTELTEVQRSAYSICTTNNDFNLATKSPIKQKVTLNDENPSREYGDIGYTTPENNLVDLTISKSWDDEIQERLDNVKIKLYQVDPNTSAAKLYAEKSLAATNGWKHTFTNLNKSYKYYVEEYVDTGFDGDQLVGTSEAKFINADSFDSQITASTTSTNEASGYFANFTFNPNIVGPTIVITNKEIVHDYRVVFHNNYDGYSNINSEDYFRIYCRENAISNVKKNTGFDDVLALSESVDDIHQYQYTIDSFYDIPENEGYVFAGWYYDASFNEGGKPMKWTTDDYSGDNEDDHDGSKYSITENNVYHIYAHWIPVGTVTKHADDEKILNGRTYYGGFELIGVQIRNYRLDPNFDDDAEKYYGYKKEVQGLRYITSIRNGLLAAINKVYDVDAEQEFYDYEGSKTYSTNAGYQNIDYGYVTASEANWIKFRDNYNGKNGYVYDQLKYNATNVNGEKTSSKYKYVSNVECTSSVGPNFVSDDEFDLGFNNQTQILDHRNYAEYRIMSMVVTYNELNDSVNMSKNVIARPYIKYVDSNGLVRVYYSNYQGSSEVGKGCMVSYNDAYNQIQEELHNVILYPVGKGGNN